MEGRGGGGDMNPPSPHPTSGSSTFVPAKISSLLALSIEKKVWLPFKLKVLNDVERKYVNEIDIEHIHINIQTTRDILGGVGGLHNVTSKTLITF